MFFLGILADYGAVFTFGRSRFVDSKFWIRDNAVIHLACGDEHSAVLTGKFYFCYLILAATCWNLSYTEFSGTSPTGLLDTIAYDHEYYKLP